MTPRPAPRLSVLVGIGFALLGACRAEPPTTRENGDSPVSQAAPVEPIFVDIAARAGLDFVHRNGATGGYNYPELMTGGGGFLDFDGDGFLDVYLVQGGELPPAPDPADRNLLFRNRGDGSFEDVTTQAGVGDTSFGIGMAAADYDGDGDVDLYVTNLGANRLYRSNGDGTFTDETQRAGVGTSVYSSSAVFTDIDGDGDLDLFVANYVDWSPAVERPCIGRNGTRGYCSPSEYLPLDDTLYRNDGDGTFTDISAASGIAGTPGPGLGVVSADFDGDGLVDIYVANDQAVNHLWMNRGDGRFIDEALIRGAGLNETGEPEAGMGVMAADPDDDGDWDLWVVHLSLETNTFYRNENGHFRDVTDELGLGQVSQPYTGFGTALFDVDNDGVDDIFIANGKVTPGSSASEDYREPNQLLRGLADGTYRDISAAAGEALALVEISRAAAFGDVDNDGDVDILVVNNDGPVRLLRNEVGDRRHWLLVDLCGGEGRDRQAGSPAAASASAIGAVVTVEVAGRSRRRLAQPGYSWAASNDPRVHFGLGDATRVDRLIVDWPDGTTTQREHVEADRILRISRDGGCDG